MGTRTAKTVVKWAEDSDSEENSELSLCLVGKLWTTRRFNSNAFMNTITKIWSPSKGMDAKEIDTNLFLFQFFHWKDLERVVEGEPWFFDKNVVVLKQVLSEARPSEIAETLTHAPFWVRIYDCPLGGRKERRIKVMAESIGTFIKTDDSCTKEWTKSIRTKILMDLREPFIDEITLEKENGQVITLPVKYERLPNICYYCGRVGHVEKDCEVKEEAGDGGNTYGFGEWMRASPWKVSKDGNRGINEKPGTARRLILKPKPTQKVESIPSIEQMTNNLLKVSFERIDHNRINTQGTNEVKEDSGEGATVKETVPQREETKAPIMTSKKKGMWHRLKRAPEDEVKGLDTGTNIAGKRDIGGAEIVDAGASKKLKQGSEIRDENDTLNAVAAKQPRGSP